MLIKWRILSCSFLFQNKSQRIHTYNSNYNKPCGLFPTNRRQVIVAEATNSSNMPTPKHLTLSTFSVNQIPNSSSTNGNIMADVRSGMMEQEAMLSAIINANNTIFDKDNRMCWFRLDDGVMGGKSYTDLVSSVVDNDFLLHFHGTINTEGGGFTSVRTKIKIDASIKNDNNMKTKKIIGFKIRFRGDGKTYKFFVTNRVANSPSWQVDMPTSPKIILSTSSAITYQDSKWEELDIYFDQLVPYFGRPSLRNRNQQLDSLVFDLMSMNEMGIMLSLKLSNGRPNPIETFGMGIFPFYLQIHSIEILHRTE